MPKIIENLRERLLQAARRAVDEQGYGALTMRKIASACGVGVGTVYNYFSSKELLVASFMVEDWEAATVSLRGLAHGANAKSILSAEYDLLAAFSAQHEKLFSDPVAKKEFSSLPQQWHRMLREQFAAPLLAALQRAERENAPFVSQMLAESLLAWAAEGTDKETLLGALAPLL